MPNTNRRRRGGPAPSAARSSETLRRTGSKSYQAHRDVLMSRFGPVCAYCGETFAPEEITLDHVQPRKGKVAYDRSDNLVLACKSCNAAKADMPFLGFLLARRSRGCSCCITGSTCPTASGRPCGTWSKTDPLGIWQRGQLSGRVSAHGPGRVGARHGCCVAIRRLEPGAVHRRGSLAGHDGEPAVRVGLIEGDRESFERNRQSSPMVLM